MTTRNKTMNRTDLLLEQVRSGAVGMTRREQIELTARLAIPSILAQISTIIMEYIDASMVGHLGASESASIGIVATTTWLFWGLGSAVATGFSVQVAHRIGARDSADARNVLRQAFATCLFWGLLLCVIGVAISWQLPWWNRGYMPQRHSLFPCLCTDDAVHRTYFYDERNVAMQRQYQGAESAQCAYVRT